MSLHTLICSANRHWRCFLQADKFQQRYLACQSIIMYFTAITELRVWAYLYYNMTIDQISGTVIGCEINYFIQQIFLIKVQNSLSAVNKNDCRLRPWYSVVWKQNCNAWTLSIHHTSPTFTSPARFSPKTGSRYVFEI